MRNVIDKSILFTHGGNMSGLYGILATNKLSSNSELARSGDNVFKVTDPTNQFKQEDGFIFFESAADRGNLKYSEFKEKEEGGAGFTFLVVASAESLLEQVDMLGNSDGILMGRSDGEPLRIDMKSLNHKILVPESYKEDVEKYCAKLEKYCAKLEKYCAKLKKMNIETNESSIVFKPASELERITKHQSGVDGLVAQQQLAQSIGLDAKASTKDFSVAKKTIGTKTSSLQTTCSEPLAPLSSEDKQPTEINNAADLVKHMRERPTPANIQRNSMLLFLEPSNTALKYNILKLSQKRPMVLDLMDKPEDLAFALNNLARSHPDKEKVGEEERVKNTALSALKERVYNSIQKDEDPKKADALVECLAIATKRDITPQECEIIVNEHTEPEPIVEPSISQAPAQAPSQTPAQMPAQAPEQTWHVAIDRNHQPNQLSTQEVMGLINTNEDSDILVWREKMANWDDARKMEDFKAPTFEKDIALTENKQQPTNVLINKVAEPSAVTPEATKPQEKVNPVEDLPLKKDAVLNSMHKMREQFKPQPKKSLASAETPKPKAPMKPSPSIKTTPFKM